MGSSKQAQQDPIAKVVGRVMGGSTAVGDEHPTIDAFQLASRLITNGEYLQFMHDGGYERPEIWLSDGWNTVQANGWKAPMYWEPADGRWKSFTLAGLWDIAEDEPVCHVSYYEADAYARWQFAGIRLANEAAR